MGLHDTFGYLKHKLWPKEGLRIKLTTKNQESSQIFVRRWHGTYRGKALNKGYNFILDLTSIKGLHTKLWAPKSRESHDKLTFGCWHHGQAQRIL